MREQRAKTLLPLVLVARLRRTPIQPVQHVRVVRAGVQRAVKCLTVALALRGSTAAIDYGDEDRTERGDESGDDDGFVQNLIHPLPLSMKRT
jgi:hypothetical protein